MHSSTPICTNKKKKKSTVEPGLGPLTPRVSRVTENFVFNQEEHIDYVWKNCKLTDFQSQSHARDKKNDY